MAQSVVNDSTVLLNDDLRRVPILQMNKSNQNKYHVGLDMAGISWIKGITVTRLKARQCRGDD